MVPAPLQRSQIWRLALKAAALQIVCVSDPRARVNDLPIGDHVLYSLNCLYARQQRGEISSRSVCEDAARALAERVLSMDKPRLGIGINVPAGQVGSAMSYARCKLLAVPWVGSFRAGDAHAAVCVDVACGDIAKAVFEAKVWMTCGHRKDVFATNVHRAVVPDVVVARFGALPVAVALEAAVIEQSSALVEHNVCALIDRRQWRG